MNSSELKPDSFFTTNGKDVWKLQSYFTGPSCEVLNLETGNKQTFGMNGLTARGFHKIKMPVLVGEPTVDVADYSQTDKEDILK